MPDSQQIEDVLPGRLDAAHDLGHERDGLVLDDRGEVGRQDLGIRLVRALLRRVADERLDHAQPVAGRALDVVGVFVKESVYRRPDGPVAQKGDGNVNGRHEPPAEEALPAGEVAELLSDLLDGMLGGDAPEGSEARPPSILLRDQLTGERAVADVLEQLSSSSSSRVRRR